MNANTSSLSSLCTASQPAVRAGSAPSAVATRPSVRYTLSQLHLSATEIDRRRLDIQMRMPQVAIGALHQFLHGERDGPVPFHYPGRSIAEDLS